VVGITIYTATVERVQEYGVLKAIGASAGQLFRIVLAQSAIVGVTGFAIGVPLTVGVNRLAERYVPEFVTLVLAGDVAAVFVAAVGMALLASLIPVRRLAGIDPASVFRA
jgi:putative ABC transport system permease protein